MTTQFINTKKWGIDAKRFDKCIKRLKKHVPKADGVLNVVFVDDAYIRKLNKEYRKKDKVTDVLSFSYLDTPDFKEAEIIGEIYISVPTAERQVKEYKHGLQEELNKLFVHGALHVFGYDHETDEEWGRMEGVERKVLGE